MTQGEQGVQAGLHDAAFKRTFPFPPYGIQLDLMRNIYKCIEERRIGLLESPTGTGKTLSIICGTLTWLLQVLPCLR